MATPPQPFLAGQRLAAGQLNDAVEKTLDSVEVGVAGAIATTAGTTELNITQMAIGPVALVAGGLYRWDIRLTLQATVATDTYRFRIRRDTALTGTVVTDWSIPAANTTGVTAFVSWDNYISSVVDPAVSYFASLTRTTGTGTLTLYGQTSTTERTGIKLARDGYSAQFRVVT